MSTPLNPQFDAWRNPNGTYNGVAMMADITGLSQAEILWTWNRLSLLLKAGMDKKEAMACVKEQAKSKPWTKPDTPT